MSTWTGAALGDNKWSNPGNWSPASVPVPNSVLTFPSGTSQTSNVNDLAAGTAFSLNFTGGGNYTLSGNSITLLGLASTGTGTITNVVQMALILGSNITATVSTNNLLILQGIVSGTSTGITLAGSSGSSAELSLGAVNTFTGATIVSGGTLLLAVAAASASTIVNVNGGIYSVFGSQATATVTIASGATLEIGLGGSVAGTVDDRGGKLIVETGGILTAPVTVETGGIADINGTQQGGTITVLTGGVLQGTGKVGAVSAAGGTVFPFDDLLTSTPGMLTAAGGATFTNASTVQVVIQSSVSFSQLLASPGSAINLGVDTKLLVGASTAPVPLGTVATIMQASTITGTFKGLPNGAVVTGVDAQTYQIQYIGSPTTMVTQIRLLRLNTTTTSLVAFPTNVLVANQQLMLTATVSRIPAQGTTPLPTGTVTFMDGTNVLGIAAVLPGGQAVLNISNLAPGQHQIVASYSGDGNFSGSTSSVISVTVSANFVVVPLQGQVSFCCPSNDRQCR
jgi:hypothetical protein